MADDAPSMPLQSGNNSGAPQMPQIKIVSKPEPLRVNLSKLGGDNSLTSAPNLTSSVPTPTPAPAPTPVTVEPAVEGPKASDDKNVFTQLFGDDKVMQSADLMGAVNSQGDRKTKSVFEKKPTLKSLQKEASVKARLSGSMGRTLLHASVLLLILTGGFFYTQNNANFSLLGANSAQKALVAEASLTELQSEVIVQKHLTAVLLLDQFSSTADSYLYNLDQSKSDSNSSNRQEDFAADAVDDLESVQGLLITIQSSVDSSITPDQKVAANTLVSELVTALESKAGEVSESTLSQDIQDLQTARSLIQSDEFRASLLATSSESLDATVVEGLITEYTELNKSTHAVIGLIRNARTEWSGYFDEIETLTKKVDPLFNTEFPGNITLSSVHFEGSNVSISGQTSTDDTKNFTLVSNYIDTLEASSSFKNVGDRSFSKNASEDDYTGQFRITLELEK